MDSLGNGNSTYQRRRSSRCRHAGIVASLLPALISLCLACGCLSCLVPHVCRLPKSASRSLDTLFDRVVFPLTQSTCPVSNHGFIGMRSTYLCRYPCWKLSSYKQPGPFMECEFWLFFCSRLLMIRDVDNLHTYSI